MAEDRRLKIAVLLSGNGSSLENLCTEIDAGRVDAEVVLVIASREQAFGLERARRRGIPAVAVPRKRYPDPSVFNDALHSELAKLEVDLVACLGFLSPFELRGKFEGRAINVHPALIPAFSGKGFYGHRVHEAVIAAGVRVSGATVHLIDAEYDHGPILAQEAVPVLGTDTPDSLAARVMALERRLVPRVVQWIAEGRIHDEGGRIRIDRS